MINGLTMDTADNVATFMGFPVPDGTLTLVQITRMDSSATSLEVLNNGAVVYTLVMPASAGRVTSGVISASISAGLVSFRNISTGTRTQNTSIVATIEPD
jgi:hypothetical protein